MKKYGAIILLLCLTNYACGEPHVSTFLLPGLDYDVGNIATPDDGPNDVGKMDEKRLDHADSGLGRRAYTYANGNGVKRLPVYNFGLGKRARPYSFGLGKRAENYGENPYSADYERYLYQKRNLPYNFGLGKRIPVDESDYSHPRRNTPYDFGIGR